MEFLLALAGLAIVVAFIMEKRHQSRDARRDRKDRNIWLDGD